MNLVADQCAETAIHELVACKRTLARKFLGDDERLEVGVVRTEDLDRGIFESCLDQATYLDWVHTDQILRKAPGRAVYRESPELPNAPQRLCMIAGPQGLTTPFIYA